MTTKNTLTQGKVAEISILDVLPLYGWDRSTYKKASTVEDRDEHWDLSMAHLENGIPVVRKFEVKSRKRLNRHDEEVQDEWVWLELVNVRGDQGWLLGKADFIAFANARGFLVVQRVFLLKWVCDYFHLQPPFKIPESLLVHDVSQAPYNLYRRHNRLDVTTRVEWARLLKDLPEVAYRQYLAPNLYAQAHTPYYGQDYLGAWAG